MDWFKGFFPGKPHISWENLWFPIGFPLSSHDYPMFNPCIAPIPRGPAWLPLGSQLPAAGRGSPAGTFPNRYLIYIYVKEKPYNKDRCYIYIYTYIVDIYICTAHILVWYDNMYVSYIYTCVYGCVWKYGITIKWQVNRRPSWPQWSKPRRSGDAQK